MTDFCQGLRHKFLFSKGETWRMVKIASLSKVAEILRSATSSRAQDTERLIRNCSAISKREIESRTSDIRRYLFDTSAARPDQFCLLSESNNIWSNTCHAVVGSRRNVCRCIRSIEDAARSSFPTYLYVEYFDADWICDIRQNLDVARILVNGRWPLTWQNIEDRERKSCTVAVVKGRVNRNFNFRHFRDLILPELFKI